MPALVSYRAELLAQAIILGVGGPAGFLVGGAVAGIDAGDALVTGLVVFVVATAVGTWAAIARLRARELHVASPIQPPPGEPSGSLTGWALAGLAVSAVVCFAFALLFDEASSVGFGMGLFAGFGVRDALSARWLARWEAAEGRRLLHAAPTRRWGRRPFYLVAGAR